MKYAFISFSATGNTAYAVNIVSETLLHSGHQTILAPILNKEFSFSVSDFDVLIAAFPVLAFSAPALYLSCIKKIPNAKKGQRAAVLAVDGGNGFQAANQIVRILRRKGFNVFLSARAGYCENWKQVGLTPALDQREQHNAAGDLQTKEFAVDLLSGNTRFFKPSFIASVLSRGIAFLFLHIGRRFLGKLHIADEDCNLCGLCVKTCPVSAIRMDAKKGIKPLWNFSCESCNRCLNICPKNAINSSLPRAVILILAITFFSVLPVILWINQWSIPLASVFPVNALVHTLAIMFLIVLGHWFGLVPFDFFILQPLSRTQLFSGFLSRTFTKDSPQYVMKGFKP